jgi:hypothetical protein
MTISFIGKESAAVERLDEGAHVGGAQMAQAWNGQQPSLLPGTHRRLICDMRADRWCVCRAERASAPSPRARSREREAHHAVMRLAWSCAGDVSTHR